MLGVVPSRDWLNFLHAELAKIEREPFGDFEKVSKKSHKAGKKGESHSAEKVNFFALFVKKIAGFEHEPSGLKSKHLTTSA